MVTLADEETVDSVTTVVVVCLVVRLVVGVCSGSVLLGMLGGVVVVHSTFPA